MNNCLTIIVVLQIYIYNNSSHTTKLLQCQVGFHYNEISLHRSRCMLRNLWWSELTCILALGSHNHLVVLSCKAPEFSIYFKIHSINISPKHWTRKRFLMGNGTLTSMHLEMLNNATGNYPGHLLILCAIGIGWQGLPRLPENILTEH